MKIKINVSLLPILSLCLFGSCVYGVDDVGTLYASFQQAMENQDDPTALDIGDKLFTQLGNR